MTKQERNTGLQENYEYYPNGLLKAAIAQGMRYTYTYDEAGRLKEKSAGGRPLLSYAYDWNGNKIKQTDITGKETEYHYNIVDQLQEIYDNGKQIARYEYDTDGMIKSVQSGEQLSTRYTYDSNKNMTGLQVSLGEESIVQNYYRYDNNGNLIEKQQKTGNTNYFYDNLNRVAKVEYPTYSEELYYNKANNRTKRISNGVEELYKYDARNQLQQ